MGASFAIATGSVPTFHIAAPPNGSSVWVRVVDEVSGAVFEQEITADLPANTQFLSPRLFMNNGATATAVAYLLTEVQGVAPEFAHVELGDGSRARLRLADCAAYARMARARMEGFVAAPTPTRPIPCAVCADGPIIVTLSSKQRTAFSTWPISAVDRSRSWKRRASPRWKLWTTSIILLVAWPKTPGCV